LFIFDSSITLTVPVSKTVGEVSSIPFSGKSLKNERKYRRLAVKIFEGDKSI